MAQLVKVVLEYRIDDGVDPKKVCWDEEQNGYPTSSDRAYYVQAVKLLSLEVTGTCPDSIF